MRRAGWTILAFLATLVFPGYAAKVASEHGARGGAHRRALASRGPERSHAFVGAWGDVRRDPQETEQIDGGRPQIMRMELPESLSQLSAADQNEGDNASVLSEHHVEEEDNEHKKVDEHSWRGWMASLASDVERRRRSSRAKVDCAWKDWDPWLSCSEACGGGVKTRTRGEEKEAQNGGKECEGANSEEEACNLTPCPVDCVWGDWGQWMECSKTCAGGKSLRTRSQTTPASNGGRPCDGAANESKQCNAGVCPVDCTWGDWGRWSSCTKTCGSGTIMRTRASAEALGGGRACEGSANETVACNTDPCPVNCQWSDWRPWESCSASCGNGTRSRTRAKLQEAQYGGSDCAASSVQQDSCMDQPCVVDCQWGPWSDWPACSVTCGGGSMERNRSVEVSAENRGKPCDGSSKEEVSCGVAGCPVNCEWTDWGRWADCSRTCGGGKTSRARRKALEASNGGEECAGSDAESRECNLDGCPVDCEWGDWSPWSNCSKTCGGGVLLRRRNVTTTAAFGGRACQGKKEVSHPCNTEPCPVDCVWSDWGRWGACAKTCGNGTSLRIRQVKVPALSGGKPCPGTARELSPCNTNACPVNCHWGEWGNWSNCSQTCGSGVKSRRRAALNAAQNGGAECPGHDAMEADCNTQACPVNCKWEPWTDWGPCPVTCGGFQLARVRAKQEESYGGEPCVGSGNETVMCGQATCSDNATFAPVPDAAANVGNATNASSASSARNASNAGNAGNAGNASSATAAKSQPEEKPENLPPANATGGQPRHIVGDLVLAVENAPVFARNEQDKTCLAAALAYAAGIRKDSVIVDSLTASTPVVLLSLAQRLGAGLVDARFKITTDDISGRNITSNLRQMNVSKVTFFLADQLSASGLAFVAEIVSISADEVDATPAEANASSSSSSSASSRPTTAGSIASAAGDRSPWAAVAAAAPPPQPSAAAGPPQAVPAAGAPQTTAAPSGASTDANTTGKSGAARGSELGVRLAALLLALGAVRHSILKI